MKTILVATDGSERAGAALELAVQIAGETGAALCCVSVDDSLDHHRHRSRVRAASESGGGGGPRDPVSRQRPWRRSGPAVERILELADERDADLIVVGSRGHGAIVGRALGSVSMGLVREEPAARVGRQERRRLRVPRAGDGNAKRPQPMTAASPLLHGDL